MNETQKSPRRHGALDAVCIGASMMALVATSVLLPNSTPSTASSHREAPLIAQDQFADVTDVYAFVSPDITSTVTLIANWIPFEDATGGPNFWHYDPLVHYYVKVDQDGDAIEDISWEWTFSPLTIKNTGTFLYNTYAITDINDANFNIIQTYTVTEIAGPTADITSTRTVILSNKVQPPNYVGPRTFALKDYDSIAAQAIYTSTNGYKIFTGQRDDPFFVDIGSIFDLGALRPFNNLHLIKQPPQVGIDSVGGFNIHTTAIQVPKTDLTMTGCNNTQADKRCVIGVWATSERPSMITRGFASVIGSGPYVQVARLGNPLINEAVLPLALKDAFNGLDPKNDTPLAAGGLGVTNSMLFQKAVFTPELQTLLPTLYPKVFTASVNLPTTPRGDLFQIFLTGIPGVTQQVNSGDPFSDTSKVASELLRLNVAIPANTAGVCKGKIFGALDGDFAGFPNGRRLEDDVTDIALRAIAGGYGPILAGALGLPNFSPGNLLSDGVQNNDKPCLPNFPYMATPHNGYNDLHPYPQGIWMPVVAKGQ